MADISCLCARSPSRESLTSHHTTNKKVMALKIFNSLTKAKQSLIKTNTKSSLVTFYVCGPTVYDSAHLGHGRTYVLFDAMRRVLTRVCNKEVVYVMNITDVDDKILNKCKHTNETRAALAERFETEFFQDMLQLGVQKPTICPHATEYIPEMVAFIGRLMNQGYAYRTGDGSVYLDSHLANAKIGYPGVLGKGNELSAASELSTTKRHVSDFALWKSSTELDNVWDCSPFGGMGRPGWHLECSAMIDATIGRVGDAQGGLDIHGGGIDLCFPHHTNERCQSQLMMNDDTAKPWAQFFCHTGHVTIKHDKMSKSTGNFITLRALLGKELSPRQLRLLFLSQRRYSASLEWTEGSVTRAKALDQQLSDFFVAASPQTLATRLPQQDIDLGEDLALAKERVHAAMLDDFDFPKVFDIVQHICKQFTTHAESCFAPQAKAFVLNTLEVLGFGGIDGVQPAYHSPVAVSSSAEGGGGVANDQFVDEIVAFRSQVRMAAKSGNMGAVLAACDKFRNANHGSIIIQDLKDGSSAWKRKV